MKQDYTKAIRTTDEGSYTPYARRIFGVCNNMDYGFHNELFAEWFIRAFPDQPLNSYIEEWVERFRRGAPTLYMDEQRKEIYLEVVRNYDTMRHKK